MDILVLHPGALGDIILSLPALRILRDRFRNSRISMAANVDFASVAAAGYADRILSLSALPLHRIYGVESVSGEDLEFWRGYDRILSWTGAGQEAFSRRLSACHPCVHIAAWKPIAGSHTHAADMFLESLRPWCIPPAVLPVPEIRLDSSAAAEGVAWLRKQGWSRERALVALHPGAGSDTKRWPLRRYRELAQHLRTRVDLLIIEGPAEPGLGTELALDLTATGVYLASLLPLAVLAAVMSFCRAFVGNDSGIAHLAAGLKIPSLVLFGPTKPENWAPLGPHVVVVRDAGNCCACVCGQETDHSCLDNVTVDNVLQQLARILPVLSARHG